MTNKEIEYTPGILNNFAVTSEDIYKVENLVLGKKNTGSRKKISGLEIKRADIIPAGIIILTTILRQLKLKKITVSGYALREGIIIDSIQKSLGGNYTDYLHNIRMRSVEYLAKNSNYDIKHCRHVAGLSVSMFDQLKTVHMLGDEFREYLYFAALLHDIGYHISHDQHHRHSYYIIRHSNLLGFTDLEIALIANVARYHRKSHPKNSHPEFVSLPPEFQQGVKKLASILRVADALDRTHAAPIKVIKCRIKEKSIELVLDNNNQIDIELWSLDRRKGLFEAIYSKKIIVA
jgi:exopolyphosphatase/guanosine-5'-triphosphate,3'-diphosphate pyrophosphatase